MQSRAWAAGGGCVAEAMAQQQQQHFNTAYARSRLKNWRRKRKIILTTATPTLTATSTATATAALLLVVLFMVCLLQRCCCCCCGTVLAKRGQSGGRGVGASGSVEKPRLGLGGLLCNEAKRLTLFVRFFARCFVCFFFETGIPCEYGSPSSPPLPSPSSLHLCQLLAWAQPLHPYSA